MESTDVSIHGWPIGPVPLGVGVISMLIYIDILRRKKPLNRDNTFSPIGFAPLIVVFASMLIGVVERKDLSGLTVILAGIAGIAISVLLSAILHAKVGVPLWEKWVKVKSISTKEIAARFLWATVAVVVLIAQPLLFASYMQSTKCNARLCEIAAVAMGSNLSASGLLWILTIIFSLFGVAWLLYAVELVNRMLTAVLGPRIGG